ncbi:hypothetical protein FIBSPDRAFT_1037456 [Athelia psychrophila]|uniref:Uncharacterized protein n=1 Tax=Athelia psychrophila TaxID=1759441 RepID=A0A166U9G7_9AGAM|nr:hypothetical protein FIBSPDRAFT_1037456 [Fibularhizoctonia sp. CBS 109695]
MEKHDDCLALTPDYAYEGRHSQLQNPANLKGRDLLKVDGAPIPESLGLVCAGIYILLLIVFIPFPFSNAIADGRDDILNSQLALYLSSLLSLLLATMLGFLDDLFDIRWRHKLPIPLLASIPLLMVYHASHGATAIAVPLPLRGINILAGCNGVEAGQALIIALSVILNDLLYLPWPFGFTLPLHLLGLESTVAVGGGAGLTRLTLPPRASTSNTTPTPPNKTKQNKTKQKTKSEG